VVRGPFAIKRVHSLRVESIPLTLKAQSLKPLRPLRVV